MTRKHWLPHLAMALSLALSQAACEEPIAPEEPPTLEDGLIGEYAMQAYRDFPLPYFNIDTGFSYDYAIVHSATLHLQSDARFELSVASSPGSSNRRSGVYTVKGDSVVLTFEPGDLMLDPQREDAVVGGRAVFRHLEGILAGAGAVFTRADLPVPPEYQYTRYTLVLCNGEPLRGLPCFVEYDTYNSSSLRLGETGKYAVQDEGLGASLHYTGTYTVSGDSIWLAGLGSPRAAGTLRGDTLALGPLTYAREQ